MTVIRQEDFIASVAGALQYISYYHPVDYIRSLAQAYEREQSPAARDAMAQILINSRMCAEGHRPICQDTGIVNAFVKLGMDVRFEPGSRRRASRFAADGRRRRAPRLSRSRQQAARQPAGRPRRQAHQHQRQHAGRGLCRSGARRNGRGYRRGQGRRLGGQVEVRHAQSQRFGRRLGAQDGAHHGRGLVPAGNSRHRHRRHGGEGHAAGQAIAHGPHRHSGTHRPRPQNHRRKASRRALRQSESPRHRRAGIGRPDDRARREGGRHARARGQSARGHDPQLRRHAPRAHRARRLRPGLSRSALARRLAEAHLRRVAERVA